MIGVPMRIIVIVLSLMMSLLIWNSARADGEQRIASIGDLALENGDTIYQCQVGYRSLGQLNSDSSNVIIYPTWFSGTSEAILNLLKPDKLFNPEGYFLIIFDALGNSISSSPSNYQGRFPRITIGDMVKSQYQVITSVFHLKQIHGAIGGSMGSMQVLEWVRSYPEMIRNAVPYVCTPYPSSYDQINWYLRKTIIENGRECRMDDQKINRQLKLLDIQQNRTPDYYVDTYKPQSVDSMLKAETNQLNLIFTIDNYYTQLVAMIDHNIFRHDSSFEDGAQHIKTRIMMIVSMTDHLVNPGPALRLAKLKHYPVIMLTNNRGHLAIGYEIDLCRTTINQFMLVEKK